VACAGLRGLAGGQQGLPGAVERRGFPVKIAGLPVHSQCLLVVTGGFLAAALPVADLAEIDQRLGSQVVITDLAEKPQCTLLMGSGLLVATPPQVILAQVN
jgi:hypothetical protein